MAELDKGKPYRARTHGLHVGMTDSLADASIALSVHTTADSHRVALILSTSKPAGPTRHELVPHNIS
jgi:hypothetical protein